MLGQSFRWIDYDGMSCLMYNERGVAVVKPGEVLIRWPRGAEIRGRCGSVAQGKRYVERWMGARLNRHRVREP